MIIKISFTSRIVFSIALLVGVFWVGQGLAQQLRIAAAASLRQVMPQLVSKAPDSLEVVVTYGASGTLYQQIIHGAPFDVFMSADTVLPEKLADALSSRNHAKGEARKPIVYAYGQLALISRFKSSQANSTPQNILANWLIGSNDAKRGKLAIANPKHAPYGQLAQSYLEKLGIWQAAQPHLVVGENISQTVQFVLSGHADFALGALSLVPKGQTSEVFSALSVVPISPNILPLLPQALWVVKPSHAAAQWVDFLVSPGAQHLWSTHGFMPAHLQSK